MRKPSPPRLVRADEAAALLDRIHVMALLGNLGTGNSARDVIAFLAEHLRPGEICLARHARGLLMTEIAKDLGNAGLVDSRDAELLEALRDFASVEGWAFEEGGWTTRTARRWVPVEAAHA